MEEKAGSPKLISPKKARELKEASSKKEEKVYCEFNIFNSNIVSPRTDLYFNTESLSINIKKTLKSAILLYLPFFNEKINKSLENLFAYKATKSNIEIIIFSDSDERCFPKLGYRFFKIPNFPKMVGGGNMAAQDKYALMAFLYGLKIAEDLGLDRYFYYEWDCLIGADYWYDDLWQEFLDWPFEPYMSGTPVLKYLNKNCGNFIQNSMDYIYQYSKNTGVSMLVENVNPVCLYSNGALTFYNTEKMKLMFAPEVEQLLKYKYIFLEEIKPWDYESGIRLFREHKEESFKLVGWLKSSYSGCGDNYYNEKQRLHMLESKIKKVIHQYKHS